MTKPVSQEQLMQVLDNISDADLANFQFYAPWQTGPTAQEETNWLSNKLASVDKSQNSKYYQVIQAFLWEKYQENPWINTSVVDFMGRLTGRGFETTSSIFQIRELIDQIMDDPRNELHINIGKFVARHRIEGELYLVLTVHDDGFVEVDFLDPATLAGGDMDSGKFYHPTKPNFVLAYNIDGLSADGKQSIHRIIPSINIAYYPTLLKDLLAKPNFSASLLEDSYAEGRKYKQIGGFKQFIIEWDTGLFTKRNVSSLRTTLEWINHYETLKKYEIDHKKAAGAYLWIVTINDPKAFRTWLAMSDAERKKTGILEQYAPGGKIILPPGMDMKAVNPTLPNISGTDTDILHMVTAGLNAPEDMVTGQSGGTFASVKASRAPQGDRVSDSIESFERFLRHTFWRSIMFLTSRMSQFKLTYKVEQAVDFKNQEPVYKKVNIAAHKLIEFNFPVSEVSDVEAVARGILGVKHGSVVDTLGLPASDVAKRMGFGCYASSRLRRATEEKQFPELALAVDQESAQEVAEGETPKSGVKKRPKVVDKSGGTKEQKKPAAKTNKE